MVIVGVEGLFESGEDGSRDGRFACGFGAVQNEVSTWCGIGLSKCQSTDIYLQVGSHITYIKKGCQNTNLGISTRKCLR